MSSLEKQLESNNYCLFVLNSSGALQEKKATNRKPNINIMVQDTVAIFRRLMSFSSLKFLFIFWIHKLIKNQLISYAKSNIVSET